MKFTHIHEFLHMHILDNLSFLCEIDCIILKYQTTFAHLPQWKSCFSCITAGLLIFQYTQRPNIAPVPRLTCIWRSQASTKGCEWLFWWGFQQSPGWAGTIWSSEREGAEGATQHAPVSIAPKGPLTNRHNHGKQQPPSGVPRPKVWKPGAPVVQVNSKWRRIRISRSHSVEHSCVSAVSLSGCQDATRRALHMSIRAKIGAQFGVAPQRRWNSGRRRPGPAESVTESPEKRSWLPCGGCSGGHLLRSRLDNGHTPTATWGRGAQESVRRRDSLERSRLAVVEPRMAQASLRPQHATLPLPSRTTGKIIDFFAGWSGRVCCPGRGRHPECQGCLAFRKLVIKNFLCFVGILY